MNNHLQLKKFFVAEFHDKMVLKSGLKKTSQRPAPLAVSKSLALEKEGDKLCKQGMAALAQRKYELSYRIDKTVLGENHLMVTPLREKMVIARAD
jgi:hypothetical protein